MPSPGFSVDRARSLRAGDVGGKFQIRLILQPLIAIFLGLRFGVRDAKAGKQPFFYALVRGDGHRGALLRHAARDAIMPLIVALIIDSILQQLINHRIRPFAAVIVGGILVFLPFLIVRALANRFWTHGHSRRSRPSAERPERSGADQAISDIDDLHVGRIGKDHERQAHRDRLPGGR